jgi:hypothetical protein
MKNHLSEVLKIVCIVLVIATLGSLMINAQGPGSPNQALMRMRTVGDGVQANGANVLQIGELGTLSATATNSLLKLATAPAAGSIYLRALWIEKMTTATGTVDLKYGTGTNCATGTTTMMSLAMAASQIPTVGEYKINIPVPAGKDLCALTDAATTVVRVITN